MVDFTLLTLFILVVPAILNLKKGSKEAGFWVCLILFAVLFGFRGPTIGNDTHEYIRIFKEVNSGFYDNTESRYELGYLWLNQFLGLFTSNAQIVFVVSGLFIYYSIGRFILKYSLFPWLSLYLFLTYGFFSFSMTVIRQTIAIAILLYSYRYILNRQLIKFLIIVGIASLFHTTAVFFVFAYLISLIKPTKKNYIIFFLSVAVGSILFNIVLHKMFELFPMYDHYDGGKYFGEARTASMLYVLISSMIFILSNYIIHTHSIKFGNKETNILLMLVLFAVGVYILSLNLNILDRIAIYYNLFSIILLPNALTFLNVHLRGLLTLVIILLFYAYSSALLILRPEWNSVFPYHFC